MSGIIQRRLLAASRNVIGCYTSNSARIVSGHSEAIVMSWLDRERTPGSWKPLDERQVFELAEHRLEDFDEVVIYVNEYPSDPSDEATRFPIHPDVLRTIRPEKLTFVMNGALYIRRYGVLEDVDDAETRVVAGDESGVEEMGRQIKQFLEREYSVSRV